MLAFLLAVTPLFVSALLIVFALFNLPHYDWDSTGLAAVGTVFILSIYSLVQNLNKQDFL